MRISFTSSALLLFFLSFHVLPATLSGVVRDARTGNGIPLVNVFLANTTIGDVCDDDGRYHIEDVQPGVYQLVFSHIGYQLLIKQITVSYKQHLEIDVSMALRVHQGLELTVEAEDNREWRANLKKFERIFIGETYNAKKCRLLNPEHLSFSRNEYTGDFQAHSDAPLIVENMALGYKVNVVLQEFRWHGAGGMYAFYPQFSDLSSDYPEHTEKWQHARKQTFYGSLRHFLYDLSHGNFASFGFQMNAVDEKLNRQFTILRNKPIFPSYLDLEVISTDPFLKRWTYDGFLAIKSSVSGEKNQSFVKLLSGYIDIDEFGNMTNPREHVVSGAWGQFRMADTLPMDYVYDEE